MELFRASISESTNAMESISLGRGVLLEDVEGQTLSKYGGILELASLQGIQNLPRSGDFKS